ncbi:MULTISPECIES: PspC domain-containing protein [Ligilactobacillus]|jgi:phage shock protein PspC (stress-responsive transcriptional regulator)|uniref:PspC domain-containing protein n=1 Tax=Ligilactobacillus TaxID=2767887 RepID=UPI00259790DB|nr:MULTISPECIES: PspC domain-containing protein [Ligilactobacillus]WOY88575.1 PspC domain-containing protein [Ligilactobacillus murinus]
MRKKLYRSNDSVICGVCAGIAEYFNISPWVVRTIFLVVAVACKLVPLLVYVPILLYLGLALYLPKHPDEKYNDVFTLLSRFGQQEEKRRPVTDAKERDVKQNKKGGK